MTLFTADAGTHMVAIPDTLQYRLPETPGNVSLMTSHRSLSLLFLLFLILSSHSLQAQDRACSPAPSTDLSPQNVVKTVVDALQNNDVADNGIFTVYCFASPGNKSSTGPLERFTNMIKKGFPDMLNHKGGFFEEMKIEGSVALQPVWLTTSDGKEVGYMFKMGKQLQGEFKDMWMTDGVFPMRPDAKREQSI